MVHSCVVPGCNSRSDRDSHLAFCRLPLDNHQLLSKWASNIRRKDLPLNKNTRICSLHFESGKNKSSDEVPTLKLPEPPHYTNPRQRKLPKVRKSPVYKKRVRKRKSISVGTDLEWESRIHELQSKVQELESRLAESQACACSIETILKNDNKVQFYTGFPSRQHLNICFDFLGPSVTCLQYWGSKNTVRQKERKCGRRRKLSPLEEFVITLMRLRLGLFEEDLGDRFCVHPSTISRVFITWVNFMYHKFKEIPLWPTRPQIQLHMPDCFRSKYPKCNPSDSRCYRGKGCPAV